MPSISGSVKMSSRWFNEVSVSIMARVTIWSLATSLYDGQKIFRDRVGPNERSPLGAYRAYEPNFSASSRLFIIGQMIASKPASSAFITGIGSFHGTRQIVGIPAPAIACSIVKEVW